VLIKRFNKAVLINLILLLVCSRPNVFSKCVYILQQFKNFIYKWLSIVAIIKCAVYLIAALSLIRSGTRPFTFVLSIVGLTISYN
jgi:hypothetical protein